MPVHTTKEDVMREADLIARPAKERAARAEMHLHESGYNQYSAIMASFRLKIEKAEIELVDALEALV
jgi:hypothetical protein